MGLPIHPSQSLSPLSDKWPCRETQLRYLHTLLSSGRPSPSAIVVHGSQATGKSEIIKSYLEHNDICSAIVSSRECVTGRHLLERIVGVVSDALRKSDNEQQIVTNKHTERCENLSSLSVQLERLLEKRERFVLVCDDIDQQREAPPTLIQAIARLGEILPQLVVVLILHYAPPGYLNQAGVPHIHFPPYSRPQTLQILALSPPDIFIDSPGEDAAYDDASHREDKEWLWPRFCAAVWDSLGENVARDLLSFKSTCHRLWRPFVAPIVKGEYGTRDFTRLLVSQRKLFQDEGVLFHSLVDAASSPDRARAWRTHELPYFAKWLLIAGYLASFNTARLDELYFMKATEKKRRKKGGAVARGSNKPGQVRKIPRHLLAASPFTADRLLAILHAILPDEIRTGIDVYKQIAVLTSLRLLVRASGIGSSDPLEPGGKWRVGPMVTWEYAIGLARSLDFGLADYITE